MFAMVFSKSQDGFGDPGLGAHVGELLHVHRYRDGAALETTELPDLAQPLHLDSGTLEDAAIDEGRHQADDPLKPERQPEFKIGAGHLVDNPLPQWRRHILVDRVARAFPDLRRLQQRFVRDHVWPEVLEHAGQRRGVRRVTPSARPSSVW